MYNKKPIFDICVFILKNIKKVQGYFMLLFASVEIYFHICFLFFILKVVAKKFFDDSIQTLIIFITHYHENKV